MASSQENQKIKSRQKVTHYDFDPDATTATDVGWVDMRDYGRVLMSLFHSVGTGNVSSFKILANSQPDGSGTDVEVKAHDLTTQPDAVGDYVFLECTAQELAALGTDLRYVSANIALATATDECVVTYIQSDPRVAADGLTADSIA